MPKLSVYLFGPPRLELNGSPLVLDRNKAVALLAYLAVAGGSHSRDTLATLLWPDYDQSRAYAYLRRTLWTLRDALGESWLDTGRDTVSFPPNPDLYLDITHFHALLEQAPHSSDTGDKEACREIIPFLSEAVSLYQTGFLAGFTLRDSPGFDDWQYFQAESLRQEYGKALQNLVHCYSATGECETAIGYARRFLALDPLHEEAHRLLIKAYLDAGQRSAALRQYRECERYLQEELGVPPQPETQALYQQILSAAQHQKSDPTQSLSPQPADTLTAAQESRSLAAESKGAAVTSPPSNLPAPQTPFIGRKAELEKIAKLIQNDECRLITLLGPGGVGKTRLSLQAAGQAAHLKDSAGEWLFAHGVYFVHLSPLSSPDVLVGAIADSIHLNFFMSDRIEIPVQNPKQQLLDYLRNKRILLVLDNFEHLIPGASLLSELTADAPGITILVTSRERLNLYGEWTLEVQGMAYPALDELIPTGEFSDYSAIDLFVKSARRASATFNLQPADLPHIVHICQMVEGMPLGIELASAWVKMLPVSEIAAEIERNFDFLTTTLRDVPERHSSLRVVFEHSWELLSRQEQEVLQQLSVFRGSFRRAAAEAVAKANLPLLTALVDKSLLYHSPLAGGVQSGRYAMHELVKQYAAHKLEENPDLLQQARLRHAAFFTSELEAVLPKLRASEQQAMLDVLELEIEDIQVAWRQSTQAGSLNQLRQGAEGLFAFYTMTGRFQDGLNLIDPTIEWLRLMQRQAPRDPHIDGLYAVLLSIHAHLSDTSDQKEYASWVEECLTLAARPGIHADRSLIYTLLAFGAGVLKSEQVFELYQETIEDCRSSGDQWTMATAMLTFGRFLQDFEGNEELVQQLLYAALPLYEKLEDNWGRASTLNTLAANALHTGRYPEALHLGQESYEIYRSLGDRWRIIGSLVHLGQVYTATGSYTKAIEALQEGLEITQEMGHRHLMCIHHDSLGYIHLLLGNYEQAEAEYQHSMSIYQTLGELNGIGMGLNNLGDIARLQNRPEEARKHYSEAVTKFIKASFTNAWTQWGLAISYKKLGIVATTTGDYPAARDYFKQAMHLAWEIERLPEVLDILLNLADLVAREEQPVLAIKMLKLVSLHPAATTDAVQRASLLANEIVSRLPADYDENTAGLLDELTLESVVASFLSDQKPAQDSSAFGVP